MGRQQRPHHRRVPFRHPFIQFQPIFSRHFNVREQDMDILRLDNLFRSGGIHGSIYRINMKRLKINAAEDPVQHGNLVVHD